MNRTFKVFATLALMAAPVAAQSNANAPVVTVLSFNNSSVGPGAKDWDGMGTGIMDLLITDLASGTKVRVVDRERVNKLLEEQNLTKSGAVDANTAIRVGKLMGACYSIYGSYMRLPNGQQTLTLHTTSNETGQIQNAQKIESKSDDVMAMIAEAAAKFTAAMNVSACPGNAGARRTGDAGAASAQQQASAPAAAQPAANEVHYAKTLNQAELKKLESVKLDARTMLIYSRALDAKDRKENAKAKQLAEQVVAKYPGFSPASELIKTVSAGN
jgi:TolB-like protein